MPRKTNPIRPTRVSTTTNTVKPMAAAPFKAPAKPTATGVKKVTKPKKM